MLERSEMGSGVPGGSRNQRNRQQFPPEANNTVSARIRILENEAIPALNNLLGDCVPIVQICRQGIGAVRPDRPKCRLHHT